jgi:hypothetical protein
MCRTKKPAKLSVSTKRASFRQAGRLQHEQVAKAQPFLLDLTPESIHHDYAEQ